MTDRSLTELVARIAVAISEMEGYTVAGSRALRQNNPGNLRQWGATPRVDGYCYFASPTEGWTALRRQVAKNVGRGLTLLEFFAGKPGVYAGYAPAADANHPKHYAEFVGQRAGIPIDVPLNKLYDARESAAQREER